MEKTGTLVETFVVHQMGGGSMRLVPEKDIIVYLESLKNCPFCGGRNLVGKRFYSSYNIDCNTCGFVLSSNNLYHHCKVEGKTVLIETVIRKPIEEEVEEYENELIQKIMNLAHRSQNVASKLELRLKHKQKIQQTKQNK